MDFGRSECPANPPVLAFSPRTVWLTAPQWGVLYTQIGGLPYIFENIYGFNVTQSGLAYITLWYVDCVSWSVRDAALDP